MIGAYVLAGELATHDDPIDAFARYQTRMRPFVEANQDLAGDGGAFLLPLTQAQIDARNRALAGLAAGDAAALPGDTSRPVHGALQLLDYGSVLGGRR